MEVKNGSLRANKQFSNAMFLSLIMTSIILMRSLWKNGTSLLVSLGQVGFFPQFPFFFDQPQQLYKEDFLPRNKASSEHGLKYKMCVSPIDCTQLLYSRTSWCATDTTIQPFLLVLLIDLVLVGVRKLQRICRAAQQLGSRRWQLMFS